VEYCTLIPLTTLTCLCARLPTSLPSILYLMRREYLSHTTQSQQIPQPFMVSPIDVPFISFKSMVSCTHSWKNISLAGLPSELLIRIFLTLGTPSDMLHILSVCRSWYRLCNNEMVWKQMLREGCYYNLPIKALPKGFHSWKDLFRVLELYREFISVSLRDYISKCCPEISMQDTLMHEFTPKIRHFLSQHLHEVRPCDMLLHGHEIADTSGFHHRWCYAAYRKESGSYDFTRYYLGIDRRYHNFIRSHVDMMMKGNTQIHTQHEWICWKLTVHFFDTVSVNEIFDMLLSMFMQRIAVSEWEVVDPILTSSEPTSCEDGENTLSPRKVDGKLRVSGDMSGYKQPKNVPVLKWAPTYNTKNAFR
jgi:hypothetical protein